jgi:hypothetical protein
MINYTFLVGFLSTTIPEEPILYCFFTWLSAFSIGLLMVTGTNFNHKSIGLEK